MPLKRKLITVGNSKAVVIPADWIAYYEGQTGQKITEISMEVNNVITIAIPNQQEPQKSKSPEETKE